MTSTPATPLPSRSLNSQVVLDEDEYTAALSKIIARDFFPSLVHLDDTGDNVNTPDPLPTPASTRFAETPSSFRGEAPRKRTRYDVNLSLDSFQARYTSEDNSSFTHILDDENQKRKARWAWAWDAQKRVEEQNARSLEGRDRALIEPPPAVGVPGKFVIEAPVTAGLIEGPKEVESGANSAQMERHVQTDKEEKAEVDVLAPTRDTRTTRIDGWKFKTRNSLMFSPDADQSPYHATPDVGDDAKSILHYNTQFSDGHGLLPRSGTLFAPPSPTESRIEAAIAGAPDQPRLPKINNYTLIPNPPSPTPSMLGPPEDELKPGDSAISQPNTPFHLPALSSRELISQKLSNSASKSLRTKAGLLGVKSLGGRATPPIHGSRRKGSMAPPTTVPRKADAAGNLTPAARSLLDRTTLGSSRLKSRSVNGQEKEVDLNRVRWTPTPSSAVRRG